MSKLILLYGGDFQKVRDVLKPILADSSIPHVLRHLNKNVIPTIYEGDVLIGMGTPVLNAFKEHSLVPQNSTITANRGKLLHTESQPIFCTFDPTITYFDVNRQPELSWDIRLANRYRKYQTLEPVLGKYQYVKNYDYLISAIESEYEQTGKRVAISVDLETVGLNPFAPDVYIVSISITTQKGYSHVIRFDSYDDKYQPGFREDGVAYMLNQLQWEQIHWLMNSHMTYVIGANFKFDEIWMSVHWGIQEFESVRFDTTIVGSLLNENRNNSLNLHAKTYTELGAYDDSFNQKYDKSRMDLVPKEDLLPYAGGDTDACYQVAHKLARELREYPRLHNFYTLLLQPSAEAFRVMEYRGICVDQTVYEDLRIQVQVVLDRCKEELLSFVPASIKEQCKKKKWTDLGTKMLYMYLFTDEGLNLQPLMFTEKANQPSTKMEHIDLLANEVTGNQADMLREFAKVMTEYNSAKKTMTTYIVGFLEHLRDDGRFHPTYMLYKGAYGEKDVESGADTGRSSAKDPAYQTIPKHTIWAKPLRRAFVPPSDDYIILKADYSQGELRIAACAANCKAMLQAYRDGLDLHLLAGARANNISVEKALKMEAYCKALTPKLIAGTPLTELEAKLLKRYKLIRQGGKAQNFGFIYGMGANGFISYARQTFGVQVSEAEAMAFRENFFSMYPEIATWHTRYKKRAASDGFIVSPLGRYRHLPLINSKDNETRSKAERNAVNSPIQATLSDLGQLAISILNREYPELWLFGFTHDDVSAYVPREEKALWAGRMRSVMENLPLRDWFGWKHQIPFLVDIEIGENNLGDLTDYDERKEQ